MNGEGEGPVSDDGGESAESQFPLAIPEVFALYGVLYMSMPKGGYDVVLAETTDHLERMEIHTDRREKAQAQAALMTSLMEDMRDFIIEHVGEPAMIEMEKTADEIRGRQGYPH